MNSNVNHVCLVTVCLSIPISAFIFCASLLKDVLDLGTAAIGFELWFTQVTLMTFRKDLTFSYLWHALVKVQITERECLKVIVCKQLT